MTRIGKGMLGLPCMPMWLVELRSIVWAPIQVYPVC